MSAPNTPQEPIRAEIHQDAIRVWLSARPEDSHDFHHLFLRHNADTQRHPETGEQLLCSSEIAEEIAPQELGYDARRDALRVRWNDGSPVAHYTRSWLAAHAYGRAAMRADELPTSPERLTRVVSAGASLAEEAAHALAQVRRDGFAILRLQQTQEEALAATERWIEAFSRAGLQLRPTHFGRIEDLRPDNTTNANNDQLGYTTAPIDLHTDQPFIAAPPRYQLLQGIVPAAQGGENAFVDAYLAARLLRAYDEEAHALLATTAVRFHRKQKAFESVIEAPILAYQDPDREQLEGFCVRFSYFTLAPHRLPFAKMKSYYRAYNQFARLVREPAHQVVAKLAPGDIVLYDNHRVLHARKPFSGSRWVRGVYFDPRGA